jgi:hypothetical protein
MLGGLLIFAIGAGICFSWIEAMKKRYAFVDVSLLKKMYGYHVLLSLVYFAYIAFNPSDSKAYYEKVNSNFRGDTWMDFYGTSTTFIEWVAYPFIHYLGFSFYAMMALFSIFGYIGFLYFYVFFRENIRFNHYFMGYNLLTLTFFLPNLHFWSASLGKGSIIFMGIGMFFFGISNVRRRYISLIIGAIVIYHVRPHVMLVILVSTAMGFIFSSKGVSVAVRVVFLLGASVAFFFIYQDVLSMVGIDEEQFLTQGLDMSGRASKLTKAASGVDITQYSLPMQVFTFMYRPLFVDAPGLLGLIVSFENVFYVIMSWKVIGNLRGFRFLLSGSFLAKSAFFSLMTISIALAQIAGNLGLAMRQKSQVMILLMFVVLAFLDSQREQVWRSQQLQRLRAERMKKGSVPSST